MPVTNQELRSRLQNGGKTWRRSTLENCKCSLRSLYWRSIDWVQQPDESKEMHWPLNKFTCCTARKKGKSTITKDFLKRKRGYDTYCEASIQNPCFHCLSYPLKSQYSEQPLGKDYRAVKDTYFNLLFKSMLQGTNIGLFKEFGLSFVKHFHIAFCYDWATTNIDAFLYINCLQLRFSYRL